MLPAVRHSSSLSTGERYPQPVFTPAGSFSVTKQRSPGTAQESRESRTWAMPTSCWTPPR